MNLRISEQHGVNPSVAKCFYCNKESWGLILAGRLPGDKEAPREAVWTMDPCDQCGDLMKAGIILISMKDGEQASIAEDYEHYKRQVDALRTERERRNAMPFIPNPYRTGGWAAVNPDMIDRIFIAETAARIKKARWLFLEDKDWDRIGLPRPNLDKDAPYDLDTHEQQYRENMAIIDIAICGGKGGAPTVEDIKLDQYPTLYDFLEGTELYFQGDAGYTRCRRSFETGKLVLIQTGVTDRQQAWDSPEIQGRRQAVEIICREVLEEWKKNPSLFGADVDSEAATDNDKGSEAHTLTPSEEETNDESSD